MRTDTSPIYVLRTLASNATEHSRAPYSKQPRGAALLLSDGAWIPGVRVESASFSLTIPAVTAAVAAAVAAGRHDVVSIALSDAARPEDRAFLAEAPTGPLSPMAPDVFASGDPLPSPSRMLDLTAPVPEGLSPERGVALARAAARRSLAPYSLFPVGCIVRTGEGKLVSGVNVEHRDWTRAVCAERSAIVSAISLGLTDLVDVYVTCPKDTQGTPCGACRQLLVEWAPDSMIWLDRGAAAPGGYPVAELLPAAFSGAALRDA